MVFRLFGEPMDVVDQNLKNEPEFEQGYPLNLSILLSGGKETN
jgi:hypothetical protein